MANRTDIKENDLHDLLKMFAKKAFDTTSTSSEDQSIMTLCENLMKLDYCITGLDNTGGNLCPQYPPRILIPQYEYSQRPQASTANPLLDNTKNGIINPPNRNNGEDMQQQQQQQLQQQGVINEYNCDIGRIRQMVSRSIYARCRKRFIAPVIMFKGKYICRSSTISDRKESFYNKFLTKSPGPATDEENNDEESLVHPKPSLFSLQEAFLSDIELLNELNVSNIIDLMVENYKVKFLISVASSEKADSDNRYESFNIFSLPYPGCEFFKIYRDNNCVANGQIYDWSAPWNDAPINVPRLGSLSDIDINWEDYKQWDLVQITQNYLKVTLKCIREENSGTLIHCISGWDRTPLFVSLVRLSLWADGLIHKSLNAMQITFLTVAYDWYLFGHQLPTRQSRREDILFFCFDIIKQIDGNEFNMSENGKRTKTCSSSGSASSYRSNSSSCSCDSVIIINNEDVLMYEPDMNLEDLLNGRSTSSAIDITDNYFATATTSASSAALDDETSALISLALDATDSAPSTIANASEITPTKNRNQACDNSSPFSLTSEMSFNGNDSPAASPNPTPSPVSNPSPISNASPSSKRSATTPIKVPRRQRTDSNNSFAMVNNCGSVESNGVNAFSLAERTKLPKITKQATMRNRRLFQVRAIFFNVYSKAIGMPVEAQRSITSFITAMF